MAKKKLTEVEEDKEDKKTEEPLSKDEKVADKNLRGTIYTANTVLIGTILTVIATALIAPLITWSLRERPLATPVNSSVIDPTLLPPLTTSSCVFPPRYGFECGQSGWDKSTFYKDQAIQTVTTTQFMNRKGALSTVLELTVDFTGSIKERKDQYRESGEVQVDLNSFPPAGFETKNVDLSGQTLSVWVRAPKEGSGDPNSKNGIQLFVKDYKDRNCYGAWHEIKQEETWFRVTWEESKAHLCDTGFDSSQPKFLGVKIALGGNSIYIYDAPLTIYIDEVNWD